MKGTRHMKKALAQTEGGHPVVQQIENPAPTRKKVCIRLQQKIRETNHKIVGLTFIKEFIACSNSEMEPHYECHLCETQGSASRQLLDDTLIYSGYLIVIVKPKF